MVIRLLTRKQYQEATGLSRTTLYRKVRDGKIPVLKTSPKKLWFLPPTLTVILKNSLPDSQQSYDYQE